MSFLKLNYRRLIIIVVIVVLVGFLLLVIRGSEDTWICVKGEWVKHGVPAAAAPTKSCNK